MSGAWGAISNMIIKAADNMNRGVENASKAGEGNNGVDYSNLDTGNEGEGSSMGTGSGYSPNEQSTSGVDSATAGIKGMGDMAKSAISSKVGGVGGESKEGEDEDSKTKPGIGGMDIPSSDERLKNIFGENEDAIKAFAKIDAIKFTYNDKAKEIHPNGENQVDDDIHYGVKAQDLLKNPLTASAVERDEHGYLAVNTPELTMTNSAVISEICKRIEIIEKVLGIKVV